MVEDLFRSSRAGSWRLAGSWCRGVSLSPWLLTVSAPLGELFPVPRSGRSVMSVPLDTGRAL